MSRSRRSETISFASGIVGFGGGRSTGLVVAFLKAASAASRVVVGLRLSSAIACPPLTRPIVARPEPHHNFVLALTLKALGQHHRIQIAVCSRRQKSPRHGRNDMGAMKSLALSFVIVLAFLANLAAQYLPTAKPAEVGLSAERLDRITQWLSAESAKGAIPGAVTMIVRDGKV